MNALNSGGKGIETSSDIIVNADFIDFVDGVPVRKLATFITINGDRFDYAVAFSMPSKDDQVIDFKECALRAVKTTIKKLTDKAAM